MTHRLTLSLFSAVLSAVLYGPLCEPAWAGYPMDPISETWSGSPQGNGKTVYSNGLDFVEVSPSGPSSSTYHGWNAQGRETTGTIYHAPRYDAPKESLSEWFQRTSPPPSRDGYGRERERR